MQLLGPATDAQPGPASVVSDSLAPPLALQQSVLQPADAAHPAACMPTDPSPSRACIAGACGPASAIGTSGSPSSMGMQHPVQLVQRAPPAPTTTPVQPPQMPAHTRVHPVRLRQRPRAMKEFDTGPWEDGDDDAVSQAFQGANAPASAEGRACILSVTIRHCTVIV